MTQHSSPSPPTPNLPSSPTRSGPLPAAPSPRPHPHGPRSPESHLMRRSALGSSHTRYHTMPLPVESSSASIPHRSLSISEHGDSLVIVDEPETGLPEAPYRPPEAVIDPPEDDPPPIRQASFLSILERAMIWKWTQSSLPKTSMRGNPVSNRMTRWKLISQPVKVQCLSWDLVYFHEDG